MINPENLKVGDKLYYGWPEKPLYKIVIKSVSAARVVANWTDLESGVLHENLNHEKVDYSVFPLRFVKSDKKFGDFL